MKNKTPKLKYILAILKTNVFNYHDFMYFKNKKIDLGKIWKNEIQIKKIDPRKIKKFYLKKKDIIPEEELEKFNKEEIGLLTVYDKTYPFLLRNIPSPPAALFYKGNIALINKLQLAVIGSRRPSPYSVQALFALLNVEVTKHFVITSGLAHGIDSVAHDLALKNQGETIAILGHGFDKDFYYPRANRDLAKSIIKKNSLIISEYYPGTGAMRQHFPQRNRLIAALSQGVLILEAHERSGSLITANFALDYNKEVLVVPGYISDAGFIGSHKIIQEGAQLVRQSSDILENFNISILEEKVQMQLYTADEKKIIDNLHQALNFDQLLDKTKMEYLDLMKILLDLESKGLIKKRGAYYYH